MDLGTSRGSSLDTECEDCAACRNRDKLFSLAQITDRPGSNQAAGIGVPEFLPTGGVQRKELAFVGAPENQIARGRKDTGLRHGVERAFPLDFPGGRIDGLYGAA